MPSGEDMESAQEMSSNDRDNATEMMESLGEPTEAANESHDSDSAQGKETHDPLYVQKRLKQQKRVHDREMRELRAQLDSMSNSPNQSQPHADSYEEGLAPGSVDEQIHKAVSYALQHKDREERKAKEAQSMQHIQKQYQALSNHLDKVGDKYDDFDEVVRGPETPYTTHMRDAALMLDMDHNNPGSAGEVLYKLGKNPEELERISRLHPLEQAREIVKLSKALISGGESKASQPRPLGQIKNTPVTNSHVVTEKTPVGSIRQRMKSGNWK